MLGYKLRTKSSETEIQGVIIEVRAVVFIHEFLSKPFFSKKV